MNTLLAKGLERSYEIGPNKVIAGIFKRIDKKHSITNSLCSVLTESSNSRHRQTVDGIAC